MSDSLPLHLQEILFTEGTGSAGDKLILSLAKNGKARKLATGVYTTNLTEAPESIVRRHLFPIVGRLYPGILLSHRSALECRPTVSGHLFLTHSYTRSVPLPGITLRLLEGPPHSEGDNPWMGGMWASGKARALLENMQPARQAGDEAKVLSKAAIEEVLEAHIRARGEEGLNALRDEARAVAQTLGVEPEFKKLNAIIGALLSTSPAKLLSSPAGLARALGEPCDTDRLELFNTLFVALQQAAFPDYPDKNTTPEAFGHFAAFEAYFSNYIEGTEFELEEALAIVESGQPWPGRREDSHDILGTYQLVRNEQEMRTIPRTADELLTILRYRHQVLLSARADKAPGAFKDKANRAGETHFVAPELVTGTLKKGFELYQVLHHPFARAAFMMFLISEVHPFLDGNGRIARLMMNAELVAAGHSRIIIPTVYREDYLGALRKLTRQREPATYIRMLQRAQAFSASLDALSIKGMEAQLRAADAFSEPEGRRLKF